MKKLACVLLAIACLALFDSGGFAFGNGFTTTDFDWLPESETVEKLSVEIDRFNNGAHDYVTIRTIHYYFDLLNAIQIFTQTGGSTEEGVLRMADYQVETFIYDIPRTKWTDYLEGTISAEEYVSLVAGCL